MNSEIESLQSIQYLYYVNIILNFFLVVYYIFIKCYKRTHCKCKFNNNPKPDLLDNMSKSIVLIKDIKNLVSKSNLNDIIDDEIKNVPQITNEKELFKNNMNDYIHDIESQIDLKQQYTSQQIQMTTDQLNNLTQNINNKNISII